MVVGSLKFYLGWLMAVATALGFVLGGQNLWIGLAAIFMVMVVGDAVLGESRSSLSFQKSWAFKGVLYLALPSLTFLHFLAVWRLHRYVIGLGTESWLDLFGGLCGLALSVSGYGVVVAHELSHQVGSPLSVTTARWILAMIGNADFSIEHVYGHHRRVGLSEDPATARRGESFYAFLWRSTVDGHRSAWQIENRRLQRQGKSFWSIGNQMFSGYLMSLVWLAPYLFFAGLFGGVFALLGMVLGKAILEAVNYIEHYGLSRQPGQPVRAYHSWNSYKRMTSAALLGLAKHSSHHEKAQLSYWNLSAHKDAPELPYGYLICMIIALFPRLWFFVMQEPLQKWDQHRELSNTQSPLMA